MKEDYNTRIKNELLDILDYFDKVCKENNLNYYLGGGTLLGSIRHNGIIPWDDDIDVYMPREDYEKLLKLKIDNDTFWLDSYKSNKNNWYPFSKIRNKKTEYLESEAKGYKGQQGMWIDIFPIDNTKNNKFSFLKTRKKIIKNCRKILSNKCYKSIKDYDDLKRKIYYIISALIPRKIVIYIREFMMKCENNQHNKYLISFGSRYKIEKQLHLKEKIFPLEKHLYENKMYPVPKDYDYVLTKIYGEDYMKLPPKEKRVTHHPLKVKFSDGKEFCFNEEI